MSAAERVEGPQVPVHGVDSELLLDSVQLERSEGPVLRIRSEPGEEWALGADSLPNFPELEAVIDAEGFVLEQDHPDEEGTTEVECLMQGEG